MEYVSDHKRIVHLEKKVAALERCLSQYIGNRGTATMAIRQPLERSNVLPLNDMESLNPVRIGGKQEISSIVERVKPPETIAVCPYVKNSIGFLNNSLSKRGF